MRCDKPLNRRKLVVPGYVLQLDRPHCCTKSTRINGKYRKMKFKLIFCTHR